MSKARMVADLKRSGLTLADITKLKLKMLSQKQTADISNKRKASYQIPYFNIQGAKIAFSRLRFLEDVKNKKGKLIRYYQPYGTESHLYFPPFVNWEQIASDVSIPITITEGEKKAVKACKEKIMCIGLGGVWAFKSKKNNVNLIEDFDCIQWSGRVVHIIFDSDMLRNDNVALATERLATELHNKGAIVEIGCVPELVPGEKCGLDDYLLVKSKDDLYRNLKVLEFERGAALLKLNSEIALIEDTAGFYIESSKQLHNKTNMLILFEDRIFTELCGERQKEYSAAQEWCKWPQKRKYKSLSYQPGKPKEPEDGTLNTWEGWGCEPKKGNIKLWKELLDFVFGKDVETRKWFEQWLAYPLQYPGTKMYTSVLLWSLAQGTGKSFIGYIMEKIYGANFEEIAHAALHGPFNTWAANRQFVMGEEITSSSKWADNDRLKSLITQNSITINEKFRPEYKLIDCINYLFNSNHSDAMFVEASDRRIMVHEIKGTPLSREFYKKLDKWYEGAGPSYLFHYLLHLDTTSFDPKAPAIDTESKHDMKLATMTDVDLFVHELQINPDHTLKHGNIELARDLYTAKELAELFNFNRDFDLAKNSLMGRALKKAGFPRTKMLRIGTVTKQLYIIRNQDRWTDVYKRGHIKSLVKHYLDTEKVTPITKSSKFIKQEK